MVENAARWQDMIRVLKAQQSQALCEEVRPGKLHGCGGGSHSCFGRAGRAWQAGQGRQR